MTPAPRVCLHCSSETPIEPVSAVLPSSTGDLPMWRYHCAACSATRYEPRK